MTGSGGNPVAPSLSIGSPNSPPPRVTGSPGSSSLCSGWRSQARVPGDDKAKKACVFVTATRMRPGFALFPLKARGMARRKTLTVMARALAKARGASRRANSGDLTTPGRAFAWDYAPAGAGHAALLRSSRPEADSAINKSSASSWQGLLVVPGGAPTPPGWLVCETSPAGAGLRCARAYCLAPILSAT